ncbi:hypothetical protein SELMODRAFT_148698 [Selaginella moellendorffii]|uniref:Phosducin domain-containing protein n=1 Tax=Selaginella moellendorffii TaxID=88036 RepID=D8RNU0_SELML|nr:phosducin-like protein 3 [Selaginella moellendorffii]EFJ26139.1 hypothetical protein SELMODRAFT_148698 [Selaginella moellendorffii]|eukprot:XP_002972918.1 phosducin-like protein 3 [Selaginella moellendorffii]
MADYHFVYKDPQGPSTEWDDIQRKLGNLPPKPPVEKPAPWQPVPDPGKSKQWIDSKSEEELHELQDDLDLDEDSRFLEEYRKKRLLELSEVSKSAKFGSLIHITGSDFIREVSRAPPDVWVVVHLYKDGVPECQLLGQCLEELAKKYPATKFVKIISTDCINNYPDFNLPTVLVYNNTNVKATLVGLHHFGGKRCTPEDVAFTLCQVGPVLGEGSSSEAIQQKVRRDFIEKIISRHEQDKSDSEDD